MSFGAYTITKNILFALVVSVSIVPTFARASTGRDAHIRVDKWNKLVSDYYDVWFNVHPSQATLNGFHAFDTKLEDYSTAGIKASIKNLTGMRDKLFLFDARTLAKKDRIDLEVLRHSVQAELLELEQVKSWEKNPDMYSSAMSQSILFLMNRDFAPIETRLRSVIEREKQIPSFLLSAMANLKNPPRVYTELAIEQLPDLIDFYSNSIPAAFSGVRNEKLLAEFERANKTALEALNGYLTFLQNKLLPASNGTFVLGSDLFSKKLLFDEMVDIPLDRLLEDGYADLRRNQAELAKVAAAINPKASIGELVAESGKNHPSANNLLASVASQMAASRDFLISHNLMTIRSMAMPKVQEMPPFWRGLYNAYMDIPGACEKASSGYFYITPVEPSWNKERVESYLSGYAKSSVSNLIVHEVFPGHFTQYLARSGRNSMVRKLHYSASNDEGWAHYSEQMMVEEGFGASDPWIRFSQLQSALLRDARFIVGISLHTNRMTYDEAVAFFAKEGHQSLTTAEKEARRGAVEPLYIVYTLGKLQVMKLREDYRREMGSRFSLKKFHDTFLTKRMLPISVIRKEMLKVAGTSL